MEEKKLTDDTEINVGMIENALKCLAGQKACDLCVYDDRAMQDGERTCINLVAEDTLDLINRLQEEIERLTEEKYQVEQNLKQCENGYELELHTARYDMRVNMEKVAKLQKQVDELTKRCEIAEGTKNRLTIFDRMAIHDKAVKDTAKKIYDMAEKHNNGYENDMCRFQIELAERYGLEVE